VMAVFPKNTAITGFCHFWPSPRRHL